MNPRVTLVEKIRRRKPSAKAAAVKVVFCRLGSSAEMMVAEAAIGVPSARRSTTCVVTSSTAGVPLNAGVDRGAEIVAAVARFVAPSEEVVTKGRISATRALMRHRPPRARSEAKVATVTVRSGS